MVSLSYRNTARALQRFVKGSHVSIWKLIQKYKRQKISSKRKKIDEFVIDETQLKVGSRYTWLWVTIEPKHRQILYIDISFERTMLIVSGRFIVASLINNFGKHPVSTSDDGVEYGIHLKHASF
jgi:transposase-like protein